eukprot:6174788-Pleurochrysis_carterae.AAC.4
MTCYASRKWEHYAERQVSAGVAPAQRQRARHSKHQRESNRRWRQRLARWYRRREHQVEPRTSATQISSYRLLAPRGGQLQASATAPFLVSLGNLTRGCRASTSTSALPLAIWPASAPPSSMSALPPDVPASPSPSPALTAVMPADKPASPQAPALTSASSVNAADDMILLFPPLPQPRAVLLYSSFHSAELLGVH